MNIRKKIFCIRIVAGVLSFKGALQERSRTAMLLIEVHRVGSLHSLHKFRNTILNKRSQIKMEVIWHQTISSNRHQRCGRFSLPQGTLGIKQAIDALTFSVIKDE